jgi:hypothetical protein
MSKQYIMVQPKRAGLSLDTPTFFSDEDYVLPSIKLSYSNTNIEIISNPTVILPKTIRMSNGDELNISYIFIHNRPEHL